MTSFFDKLKICDEVGEVPDYLKLVLTVLGFDTAGAFRAIRSDTEFDDVIKSVNTFLSSLNSENVDAELKSEILPKLSKYHLKIKDDMEIPKGHKMLLKSIVEYSQKPSQPFIVLENLETPKANIHESKKRKSESLYDRVLSCAQKCVDSIPVEAATIRPLSVISREDGCFINCCYCVQEIKAFLDNGISVSNLKKHIKRVHVKKQVELEDIETTTDTESTSNTVPTSGNSSTISRQTLEEPPMKRLTTDEDEHTKKKNELTKKIDEINGSFPPLLISLMYNSIKNKPGAKSNRFNPKIKKIALYCFIRGGLNFYNFMSHNMTLPCDKTITRYMDRYHSRLNEGKLYVKELSDFLDKNELPRCVSVTEDATKILEIVEFDSNKCILVGLTSPFNPSTGLVYENYFKASSSNQIANHINNTKKASYVSVILAKPLAFGSPTFVLSFYGTDNRFTSDEVTARYKFIYKKLLQFGIEMICTSSDGDTRFLKSQKELAKFGNIQLYNELAVAGNYDSPILALQDPLHLVKKLNHALYDNCNVLKLGKFSASLGHLIIVYKTFQKLEHNLNLSDLDPSDRLNYKRIDKITDLKVLELLKKVEYTEGTVAFLNVMRSLLIAYVNDDTSDYERIKNAVYATTFIRIWAQYLKNEGISSKHFITTNALECLEINLILLVKLLKANNLKYIYMLSSQNNESFFRCIRSYTGIECMAVNASMKSFISKTQRIQIEEKLMYDLKEDFTFSKISSRENKQRIKTECLIEEEIKDAIEVGIQLANDECTKLGMNCRSIDLKSILKVRNIPSEEETDSYDDFLDISLEAINLDCLIEEDSENVTALTVGNIQFTNKKTSDESTLVIYKGKELSIKKSNLCYMLQKEVVKINADIRGRFVPKRALVLSNLSITANIWTNETVSRGDWIVIKIKSQYFVGRVLNFKKAAIGTKSECLYWGDLLDLIGNGKDNVCFLLEPLFIIIEKKLANVDRNVFKDEYFVKNSYICHVASEKIDILSLLNFLKSKK